MQSQENVLPKVYDIVLALILLCCAVRPSFCRGFSYPSVDYLYVDTYSIQTPLAEEKTLERLTAYLVKPYANESEKVRSLYVWIVNRISYNYRLADSKNRKRIPPKTILKTRRAICSGYADLFSTMCQLAGIESKVVIGYSRYYNFAYKHPFIWSDHAWNAVKLAGKWQLLDATWESKYGKRIGNDYFLLSPRKFVVDHLPEDPLWQLLDCPISLADFTQSVPAIQALVSRQDTCHSFPDSIVANSRSRYLSPKQELLAADRAYQFNPLNHISRGVALGQYGVFLAKNKVTSSKASIADRINQQQQALNYFSEALRHIRKTKRDDYILNRKKNIGKYKRNIKASKTRIKRLKKQRKN